MRFQVIAFISLGLGGALLWGCASSGPKQGELIRAAKHPAWSVDSTKNEMIVAVSPTRQTLQMAGSAGMIIGLSVSAISDARYKQQLDDVLEGYDPGLVFEQQLETRLKEVLGEDLAHVAPLMSTAGYHNQREAMQDRYRNLKRDGHDMLLDFDISFGLFGYQGQLIAKLEGVLLELPKQKKLWSNGIVVSAESILACDKLSNPTNRIKPNIGSPRLTADENAIDQWTQDGGALLRQQFENAVAGAISAILTDMNLLDEAEGNYYLAKQAMNRKKQDEAIALYRHALELDPAFIEAKNGLSVSLAHQNDLETAIATAREITQERPEYAPAWFNLAWWYGIEQADLAQARPCYDKALALGIAPHKKLDKAFNKASEK